MQSKTPNKGDKGYRIVRLVNGEVIIGKITGNSSSKLFIERPMSIEGMIAGGELTPYGIAKKEVIILNNWIEFTNQLNVGLPKKFILTICQADSFIEKLYERQKEHEDTKDDTKIIMDNSMAEQIDVDVAEIVEGIVADLLEHYTSDDENKSDWSEEDIDKTRPDYGADYNDWSPYPEDYFD